MKKIILIALTLILSSCIHDDKPQSFCYQPDFKRLKVDETRLARIDALLQEYIDKGILPHAITFVAKSGQVIHHKVFGWKDIEKQIPLQKDDIFRMYSQTKSVTTVALMTLFEQGKFQLDDPVSKYIPEMTSRVIISDIDPTNPQTRLANSPVLIRHVIAHTAGIIGNKELREAPPERFETLEEYVKELVKIPLASDPGTKWIYHPSSDVWAYLVEYFSGKPLQEYLQEVIFDPLGIKEMAYYYGEEYKDRFVTCYQADNTGKMLPAELWSGRYPFGEDRRFANGGTGLNGNIEEFARFCQMILNGGKFNNKRILGRRTIEIMSKDQLIHHGEYDANFHFGLGFQIYSGAGSTWEVRKGASPMVSAGALKWAGAASTNFIIDPKEDMIIVLYVNRFPDPQVWEKFLNTVYQTLE